MSMFQGIEGVSDTDDALSDALYTLVANEMSQGKIIKPLWTKSLAHCDFEPTKTQAFYVRERVARLQKNIEDIRQYVSTAKRLREIQACHELDARNLHRMKEELPILEEIMKNRREKMDQEEQEIRQNLRRQFSPTAEKNKLYTWLGTTTIVSLMIPAYFFGFLSSKELYLALFFTLSLAALIQPLWWQSMDNRVTEELLALRGRYNIRAEAEAVEKLRADIPRLELQVKNDNEIKALESNLIALESRLNPLFQYDSVNR